MTTAIKGSARAVAVPLAGILFTQTSAVMSLVTVPVLATEIAGETGLGASKVGLYTSLIFGAAMFTSAASGGALFFLYAAICIGPLVFTATVSVAGSYPVAFWLGAAVSLVATVNLLRIPGTAGR